MRRPMSPLCCRFPFPNHLNPELRLSTGGGDEGSRLPGELQTELHLDVFRGIREVAKLVGHRDRRWFDRIECRFEAMANRLDYLAGMQPARDRAAGLVLHLDQHIAAGFQREGNEVLHGRKPRTDRAFNVTPWLIR